MMKRFLLGVVVSIAIAASAGCSTTARGSFCDIAKPYRLTAATVDKMTDAEVEQALAHNRKGAALCGWKP